MLTTFAVFASVFASAAAHATWQEMWVNGVDQGSWCVRLPQSNSPVQSVTTDDLACNVNASPSTGLCSVNPGDQVTVEMHQQPGDRSCADQAIGGDHWGPMLAYMAKVEDATTAVGSSAGWFKISEMGLPSNNPEYWATEVLNDNCGHFTFTIPDVEPGQYLLRSEVIALHVASSVGGAQFYMSCFQVTVGGSGTASPPTVNIPGAYGASDPGILIDIYTSPTAYTIPGPTPYGTTSPAVATTAWPTTATWNTALQPSTVPTTQPPNGGAAPPPAPTSSAPSASTPPTASSPSATSVSAVPSSTASAGTVAQYGQCGGIGWTGATSCEAGLTCNVINDYYSQCLSILSDVSREMAATATTSSQSPAFSRLAKFSAGLAFRTTTHAKPSQQRQYSDANDSEWYIPYNGPYEQPQDAGDIKGRHIVKAKGKEVEGDNWDELIVGGDPDPFGREQSVGRAGASASGHGHTQESVYDEERGRTRSRALSASSKYSESIATLGGGGGERRSQALGSPTTSPISSRARGGSIRRPVPSFLNLDTSGVKIGESPVPIQRAHHHPPSAHAQSGYASGSGNGHSSTEHAPPASALSPRESLASFWTFGRAGSKKSPPLIVHPGGGRPSVETTHSKLNTSTRQTIAAVRDRSATVGGHPQIGGDVSSVRQVRPRANTTAPPAPSVLSPAPSPSMWHRQPPEAPSSDAGRSTPSYQRHPYAAALPSRGHREHSRFMQPSPKLSSRPPILNLTVPFLSSSKSLANLKSTSNKLKSSMSTPNLRSQGANANAKPLNTPTSSPSAKWLSAETWCDALLFPRPRFRLRTAHVISPPDSPVQNNPPHSAPLQTRPPKKGLLFMQGGTESQNGSQMPQSGPPLVFSPAPSSQPLPSSLSPAHPEPGLSNKTLRPPRPKSFALDDLALPSPVPSLATVLRDNAAFDKERKEWKKKASRSFQNKRSRSLSQSRVKAKAKLVAKVEDDESELVTSFDLIAATAFHGHQALKPSINSTNTFAGSRGAGTHTNSTGLNTNSSHSRNTSNTSQGGISRGHVRKESWSKSMLKTAKGPASASGLRAYTEDLSPVGENVLVLDDALERNRTKYVKSQRGEPRNEIGVMRITPQLSVPQPNAVFLSPSPVPSSQSGGSTSHSGVGIALSTPTVLVDEPFSFTDHPYASVSQPQRANVDIPHSFNYAGPHPTKTMEYVPIDSSLHVVSVRHRMPATAARKYTPSSSLHPYATAESPLSTFRGRIPPPASMFAQVGSGTVREVLPDEIQYSPYSARYPGSSSSNSDALGVEEALSVAFSHGSIDNDQVDERRNVQEDAKSTETSDVQIVLAPPRSTIHYKNAPMPQIDEVSGRDSWQTSRDGDSNGVLMVPHPTPVQTGSSKGNMNLSPGLVSIDSSPMTSPRQFKKFDDTEDYSDLFYRPGQQPTSGIERPAVSSKPVQDPHFRDASGSGRSERSIPPPLSRSSSGSALTNLQRQLSHKYNSRIGGERHINGSDSGRSRHFDEFDEDIDDAHVMLSQDSSPPGAAVPLRMPMSRPISSDPPHLIPEDVESSRASSVLGRSEVDDSTEVFYRLGEVPALATPDPVTTSYAQRASTHLSYFGDDTRNEPGQRADADDDYARNRNDRPSHPTLLPPTSATETTRASYITSTSSVSRISQLSDFPVPPSQNALKSSTIAESYFSGTPEATLDADTLAESAERSERRSRRTTFGGIEEVLAFDSYPYLTPPDH
ncbi:hypothetical protein EW145_g5817 [Phellinidium pouzarii]|uniref:AA9 family lytic polysaccharide monooxygenase n=1 Tax=Phellinidium pouzarii TaxID=167371 RepID=A0A4S4KYX1_9AGAM|nr:hypothetical protein EW145_g5817 [Phellinidium pouzarii]